MSKLTEEINNLLQTFKKLRDPSQGCPWDKEQDFKSIASCSIEEAYEVADAIEREESCGAHFREEYQTKEGEAKRNDDLFSHIAVWKFNSDNNSHIRFSEDLKFKKINLNTRNYK